MVVQARLGYDGSVSLNWNSARPCQLAVRPGSLSCLRLCCCFEDLCAVGQQAHMHTHTPAWYGSWSVAHRAVRV